jgi:hypothetical protein
LHRTRPRQGTRPVSGMHVRTSMSPLMAASYGEAPAFEWQRTARREADFSRSGLAKSVCSRKVQQPARSPVILSDLDQGVGLHVQPTTTCLSLDGRRRSPAGTYLVPPGSSTRRQAERLSCSQAVKCGAFGIAELAQRCVRCGAPVVVQRPIAADSAGGQCANRLANTWRSPRPRFISAGQVTYDGGL